MLWDGRSWPRMAIRWWPDDRLRNLAYYVVISRQDERVTDQPLIFALGLGQAAKHDEMHGMFHMFHIFCLLIAHYLSILPISGAAAAVRRGEWWSSGWTISWIFDQDFRDPCYEATSRRASWLDTLDGTSGARNMKIWQLKVMGTYGLLFPGDFQLKYHQNIPKLNAWNRF